MRRCTLVERSDTYARGRVLNSLQGIQAPFADTDTLLRGLKKLGAGNPHRNRLPGLTPKGYFAELSQLYQSRFGLPDGRINVSMEILYGHAWKADPSRKEEQEAKACAVPNRRF